MASAIAQTYAGLFLGAVAIRRAANIDAASNNATFRLSSTPASYHLRLLFAMRVCRSLLLWEDRLLLQIGRNWFGV